MKLFFLSLIPTCFFASNVNLKHYHIRKDPEMKDPNPSGRFESKGKQNAFIDVEALLLQSSDDDFPVAIAKNVNDSISYHYRSQWKWGFRTKIGYNLPHDGWDLLVNYLRYYAKNYKFILPPDGYTLTATADDTVCQSVDFRQVVNFNQWDLEMARNFFVSRFLRLRPLVGLRNAILGQSFKSTLDTSQYVKDNVHFWGMGVLAGLDTYWNFNYQFSLYSALKLASLFGYFSPKLTDKIQNISQRHEQQRSSKSCLELELGVRWDRNFFDDAFHLGINIGFVQINYFNMNKSLLGYNQSANFDGVSGRDFTLQGFSFGIRADF
jgi:hypothetical protein